MDKSMLRQIRMQEVRSIISGRTVRSQCKLVSGERVLETTGYARASIGSERLGLHVRLDKLKARLALNEAARTGPELNPFTRPRRTTRKVYPPRGA
ncbi:hypothetical protein EVAR_24564_1 [Eumeta japonica]|uniref:Uncharacterized protein n=1 Tax=Eumeta variegata TaxID=151549 RepID=A0A4C1W7R5_EUMVA|nr:hypothetical protein EVAR_24564_1 [Eumeta japonica]